MSLIELCSATELVEARVSFAIRAMEPEFGEDGELILTLDDSATDDIILTNALMDIKRMSGGEALKVFDEPYPVVFKGVVTQ